MARSGTARRAGTASPSSPAAASRSKPGAACPAIPDDMHSRYIEAAVNGVLIGCLYLPNGNPRPGPKFDYKLAGWSASWRAPRELLALDCPVVLAGDYNIIPTDADVYKPERWLDDALFQPEPRALCAAARSRAGPTRCASSIPSERIFTFWNYWRNAFAARRRHPHRPSAAQPAGRQAPRGGRRRPPRPRPRESQRPRAGLDRAQMTPIEPMEALLAEELPEGPAGNMSPSGTASAASPYVPAAMSTLVQVGQAAGDAIFPKSWPCSAG